MTKVQHTPGPWKHEENSKWGEAIVAANGEFVVMGNCYSDITVSEEDANLITAAPELLAALEGMLEIFVDSDQLADFEDMETVKAARAAIKKAKGE